MEPDDALQRAIATISQSDPLIKLIQQVTMGRMKPEDVGLRAIVEAWFGTYRKVLGTAGLTKAAVRRLDPSPRVAVLAAAGIVSATQPSVESLHAAYSKALECAPLD